MQVSFQKKKLKDAEGSELRKEIVWHPEHINDLLLWKAFRSGDEKALVTIYDRFTDLLYNYGCKIIGDGELVKDSIQELFIEIWQNRTRLGDTDSIKFYLLKSLRRKLIRSKAKSKGLLLKFFLDSNKDVTPSHEFVLIAEQISAERKDQVLRMLDQLTKREREAVFLRYFEELNCDEIAEVMTLRKQVVYNLLHHALQQLKKSVKL